MSTPDDARWWSIHDRIRARGSATTAELHEWYSIAEAGSSRGERSALILTVIRQMLSDGDATVMDMGIQGRRVFHARQCRYGQ
jgi:hypothetical protein